MIVRLLKKIFMDPNRIATPTARSIFLSSDPDIRDKEFAFFSSIKLKNGVTKTTCRDRMTQVDEWACSFMKKGETQKILDVGISSGVTTVELCELLDSRNVDYQLTGMDSDLTAFLIIFDEETSILLDKDANPIHFEIKGHGFGYVKGTNLKHFIDRATLKLRAKFFVANHYKNGFGSIDNAADKKRPEVHRVQLVCREIMENPSIGLLEDSIFSGNTAQEFNFIRAANILNSSYFSDEQLTTAVKNLWERLEDGGLLLVCRTNFEGENNASLFQRTKENGLKLVDRFGEGVEIEDLVLSAKKIAPAQAYEHVI